MLLQVGNQPGDGGHGHIQFACSRREAAFIGNGLEDTHGEQTIHEVMLLLNG